MLLELWRVKAPSIRAYLSRKLHDHATAEDLITEAFIRLAAELDRGTVTEPAGLLWRIAQNLLADEGRRREREQPLGLLTDTEPTPESVVVRPARPLTQELAAFPDDFDQAVRDLDVDSRDAFILTELRGLTTREAGEILGVSHMTVARRSAGAREQVAEGLTR